MSNWIFAMLVFAFVLTLIRSVFADGEKYHKLCGAFALLAIGLVLNENVRWLCFIVGGLIVASEDFMLMLMVIFKMEKRDIPDIMKAFFAYRGTLRNTAAPRSVDSTPSSPPSDLPDADIPTIEK